MTATVTTEQEKVEAKITNFFDMNERAKSLKKMLDPLNKEIKDFFRGREETTLKVGDVVAEFTVREGSASMDSEKLLKLLKKIKRKDLIKKVEIPDTIAIEKLLYDQELDAKLFAQCVVTGSPVEVLVIKKAKKEKVEDKDNG